MVHADGCLDHDTPLDLQDVLNDQLAGPPWAIIVDLRAISVFAQSRC